MDDLSLVIQLLATFVFAATAAVAIVRLKTNAAGILLCVGFGIVALDQLVMVLIFRHLLDISFDFFKVLQILRLCGFICAGAGVLVIPLPRREQDLFAGNPGPMQMPVARGFVPAAAPGSGWGLAVAWIVLSALAWISGFVTLGLVADAGSRVTNSEAKGIIASVAIGAPIMIASLVVQCVWLYKTWSAVPEPCRSATPGQAVGFMFIPLFNMYWIFRAIPGLSASIRRGLQAHEGNAAPSAGYGVGIAASVVTLIPYVGMLSWPLFLIWLCLANAAKNRLLALESQAAAEASSLG
jgi:hypothetical protein